MSPVRAPVSTLIDAITAAIRHLEPALSPESIRAAVEATTADEIQLATLASVVHHDVAVLSGPAGTTCVADIEPLIRNIQGAGGTAVHVPRCVVCVDNDTEIYSRQLKARICRACALARYAATTAECVACGQLARPTYRARRGGMHCRNCIPEPDVDHRSAVITGIAALSTGLTDEAIQQIADTFTTTAARRELNWILHDQPEVFTGTTPHESVRSVRLAEALIAAGAHNIQPPRCPVCARQIRLMNALDGRRCCARCWRRRCSRGACTRCGKQRHLHRLVGTDERLCTRCFEADPANHHVCSTCGQTRFVEHRDGVTMLCRRCYRKPAAVCGTCGGMHRCWRGPDGQMICSTCAAKQRAKEPCTVCGQLRQVHVRTDTGTAMCDRCARKREPCTRCGKVLPVSARLPELGPLCSACLKREPAFFRDCMQCGVHGRTYHRGLCPACACPAVLNDLFGRDRHLNPAAQQVVDVLLKCDATAVLRWVRKTRHSGLATAIRDTDCALTHEIFDQLPASKSREWLRNLLVDAAVLAYRNLYLVRTEQAINACIASVEDRDDRAALRSYATWHHLRKLRAQADRVGLKPGSGHGAQREIDSIATFLEYLRSRRTNLRSCRQHDVDNWSSQNPTKESLHQFLAWAVPQRSRQSRTCPPEAEPQNPAHLGWRRPAMATHPIPDPNA
jgi:hypothetical protein